MPRVDQLAVLHVEPVLVGAVLEIGPGQYAHITIAVHEDLHKRESRFDRDKLNLEPQLVGIELFNFDILVESFQVVCALVAVVDFKRESNHFQCEYELNGVRELNRHRQAKQACHSKEQQIPEAPHK